MTQYMPTSSTASLVYGEFCQLSDMIWKYPRFLEGEEKLERKKLDDYFPETDLKAKKLRQLRWALEGQKLFVEFPRYLAQSSVLMAVALYETRLVQAVNRAFEPNQEVDGLQQCRTLLHGSAYQLENLRFARQVELALQVRHAVIHFSGYLGRLRKRDELKAGIQHKTYLEKWQVEKNVEDDKPWLTVAADEHGERLVISHKYAFVTCGHLRDNLCGLLDVLGD